MSRPQNRCTVRGMRSRTPRYDPYKLPHERAASGIETEGHDAEERHGAEHESPTGEAGDAQGQSQ